jgi:2',3'-cyclic-nucleotide 2'-phosphodiesterase (5'-nucleotidase family)
VRDGGLPVLVLDGGDAFGNPDAVSSLEDMLMAEYLLKGMDLCGYDAMTLGEEEFRFGETFLAERLVESDFEVTSANVVRQDDGLPYATHSFTKGLGDTTIGVIGVLYEEAREQVEVDSSIDGAAVTVGPVAGAITEAQSELGEIDVVVVLAHMPTESARELADQLTDVDVVVAAHDSEGPTAEQVGDLMLVSPGYDGKWVGNLGLVLDEQGSLSDFAWSAVALDGSWADDPELAALYQEYLERLETEAGKIVEEIPQETPEGGSYVGDTQCQPCHPDQDTQWAGTDHARAFASLEDTNHDYSPSCFPCHTTGFGFVGGFLLPSLNPAMENVQCESCHGAGEEHVETPMDWSPTGEPPPPSATTRCTGCHTPENSPDFDIDTYLPQVQH